MLSYAHKSDTINGWKSDADTDTLKERPNSLMKRTGNKTNQSDPQMEKYFHQETGTPVKGMLN